MRTKIPVSLSSSITLHTTFNLLNHKLLIQKIGPKNIYFKNHLLHIRCFNVSNSLFLIQKLDWQSGALGPVTSWGRGVAHSGQSQRRQAPPKHLTPTWDSTTWNSPGWGMCAHGGIWSKDSEATAKTSLCSQPFYSYQTHDKVTQGLVTNRSTGWRLTVEPGRKMKNLSEKLYLYLDCTCHSTCLQEGAWHWEQVWDPTVSPFDTCVALNLLNLSQ